MSEISSKVGEDTNVCTNYIKNLTTCFQNQALQKVVLIKRIIWGMWSWLNIKIFVDQGMRWQIMEIQQENCMQMETCAKAK